MSYLLDRQAKIKRYRIVALVIVALLFAFYFRSPVITSSSSVLHFIFKPVLLVGKGFSGAYTNLKTYFSSKTTLFGENQSLRDELWYIKTKLDNYKTLEDENAQLKETLKRKSNGLKLTLAAILSKPNRSPYDTMVIDIGSNQEIETGDLVFAHGSVAIGRIIEVHPTSSKVVLFSSPEEKTDVVISGRNSFLQAVGRGGGNFEIIMPKDFILEVGTEVVLPGIIPHIVAKVESILSDPRDSFVKALLVAPVNIQDLKFVEVEE